MGLAIHLLAQVKNRGFKELVARRIIVEGQMSAGITGQPSVFLD